MDNIVEQGLREQIGKLELALSVFRDMLSNHVKVESKK
jgi:hypothetical protein